MLAKNFSRMSSHMDRVELRAAGFGPSGVRDVEGSWTVTGCAVVDHEDVLAVMPTGQFV